MDTSVFSGADHLGRIFWVCAVSGTLFFIVRTVLMFTGGGADTGDGVDADFGDGSDAAFHMLSLNSLTAFVMMFGWAGLTAYIQFERPAVQSIAAAFVAGILSMLVTAWLFHQARKLVSHGASVDLKDLKDAHASVYQRIPGSGRGRVTVTLPSGGTREIDAVSADRIDIESFERVRIVEVCDSQVVSVRKM